MWGGSRAVAARGLAAGAASVTFTLRELAAALHDLPRDTHTHTHPGTCVSTLYLSPPVRFSG